MAVLHPPIDEFDRLAQPLDAAQLEVAQALASVGDGWTVFVRPRLGLARPDFIALHDRYGVCAIEVRDWMLEEYRSADDGSIESRDVSGVWRRVVHPRFAAARHRRSIFDRHFALPGDVVEPTEVVRAAVVLPRYSTEQARALLSQTAAQPAERNIAVWGGDGLHQELESILRGGACPVPSPTSIKRMLGHTVTAGRRCDPTSPVTLTSGQADIAENRSGTHIRRVRGPAGSGKSFGLAARAARLAAANKQVLVLSFNVTLANHLRELVNARCDEYGADPTLVTCANFHSFCEHIVENGRGLGIETVVVPGSRLPDSIVACAKHVFRTGFDRRYDAVLVDEGQDFAIGWWNVLKEHVLAPDGEMVLATDQLQDIYHRNVWSDEEQMLEAGFADPWIDLTGSRRMPADVTALMNQFTHAHVFGQRLPDDVFAGDQPDVGAAHARSVGRWQNVGGVNGLGRAIGREVVRLLREHPELDAGDVVFLCEYHHDGEDAVAEIEAGGYSVHHLFSRDPDDPRRNRRYRLWPAAEAVKGCTVHNFKGCGTRALVMGIGVEARSKPLEYVAMTRVAADPAGGSAFLSIINADRRLDDFESTFASMLPPPTAVVSPEWAPPPAEVRVG